MTFRLEAGCRAMALSLAAAAAILIQTPVAAQSAAPPVHPDVHLDAHLDRRTLASLPAFIDGVMAQQIATRDVAASVVTVVHKGRVIFSRGYGHADLASRRLVDPDRTLFRPGSISKLFTWVAVMQQVEAGRIDLDADVNRYIDFNIPPRTSMPIRVRDLVQHSPGLGDLAGFKPESEAGIPYSVFLKTKLPPRQWEPGTEIAYSNYGVSLAGYIVERVSGVPFADYVERNIFQPLGMSSTTFREPLPPALAPHMATAYAYKDGRFVAQPFERLSAVMPAGSASTTAADMARFMIALLNDGRMGSIRILKPESIALLARDSFRNAPRLQGMAHGFIVVRAAGPRLIGHGGNSGMFNSNLVIAPEHDFGIFISTTGGPAVPVARTELTDAVIGRIFPQAPAPRWTGSEPPPIGTYRINRRDYSGSPRPGADIKVSIAGPNIITVETSTGTSSWEQIGPKLYERVTGARAGGPYDRLEFYGPADDPKLAFGSAPIYNYHLVRP